MRVVLLGPDGQLGRDIRRAHAAAGAPFALTCLDRAALDVTDSTAMETELGDRDFDALINCTGYHLTDRVEDDATGAFAVNAHAVAALAAACAARKARLIHVSTDYVFGGDAARTTPLPEDAPTAPVNVYGASKAMGETLARLTCPDTVILRVASLFGVDGASGKGGNFVETMIRLGRERGALRVVNDQHMSPTATADVAAALMRLLARDAAPGIYHAVNSGAASWYDFAAEIIRQAGIDATVTPCTGAEFPTRARRPRYSVLDNARLGAATGRPMPPWQEALARYLQARGHTAGDAPPGRGAGA